MWKPSHPSNNPAPAEPQRTPQNTPAAEYNNVPKPMSSASVTTDQATIGKSLVIKGEVTDRNRFTSTVTSRARFIFPAIASPWAATANLG